MRFTVVALALAAILATANSARADKRVALVLGNGAYKNLEQLPNPSISAKASLPPDERVTETRVSAPAIWPRKPTSRA